MVKEQVETVLGPINPNKLGVTLPHEHLTIDYTKCSVPPLKEPNKPMLNEPLAMKNLNWLRHNPYSSLTNIVLLSEKEAVIEDIKLLKKTGGCSIVEPTSIGINRHVPALIEISKLTGVNVVCGSGFYVDVTLPNEIKTATVEELTKNIVSEINDGIDDTGVKPGIIGEVGCSWPLTNFEKRSLQAAAVAQIQTQTPVMIHPGRDPKAPFEILRIFQEAGGDAKRTVMAHLDRTIFRKDALLEFAEIGTFLEYDFFGWEISYLQEMPSLDMLNDAQRIDMIGYLISHGYRDRILVSHDIHALHQLTKYGGHSYTHILDYAVPKMLLRGIAQKDVDAMLISNPKNWLTYY